MEGKEEDVRLGAYMLSETQAIGKATQIQYVDAKDYREPPPALLFPVKELTSWSFYRAGIVEFITTFLFFYITVLTVIGVKRTNEENGKIYGTVEIQGIALAFSGLIFALVYRTTRISGGNINPAVTLGLFLARKFSLRRAIYYIVMQCLGALTGAGVVRSFHPKAYESFSGGANAVNKWIVLVGPFIGAALPAFYHQVVIRVIPLKLKS